VVEEQPVMESKAVVRLSGQAIELNAVPADVLIRTISGMQQLVYIFASDNENRKLGQRFRLTESIEQQYKLLCQPSKPGSYLMPLILDGGGQLPLFEDNVWNKLEQFFEAIASGAENEISKLFLDRLFVKRALSEVRKILPKADDSWTFGFRIQSSAAKEIKLGKDSIKRIDDWLTREQPAESMTTITGELIKIDFDERKVFLRYPPTHMVIECIYSDDSEDIMIENRRQYIQVTGQFTLDANGNPIKLTEVTRIEPLDLSPLMLSELTCKQRKFRFKQMTQFVPQLEDEYKQSLFVEVPEMCVNAFACTREELVDEISEQLDHAWTQYVLCDDDLLTPEAIAVKEYLKNVVEVSDAA
jgi:hypothetical protein